MNRKLIWLGMFAMLSLFVSSQIFSQEDDIKKRKGLMKSNNKSAKAIKGAVKEGDFATIEQNAKKIGANAGNFVAFFSGGSTAKNSRAKAEIWQEWDDFKAKASHLKDTAGQLVSAANAKNSEQVQVQNKAVGAACRACHRSYRGKKKRKK